MFICVNNLFQTELTVEELLLLPEPLYFRLLNSNLFKIGDKISILTNIQLEDNYIFNQFQEQLNELGFKGEIEFRYHTEYPKNSSYDMNCSLPLRFEELRL